MSALPMVVRFGILAIIDEYSRECLALDVSMKLNSDGVYHRLSELFIERGVPKYIRCDNGPVFTSHCVRDWLRRLGARTLFIERGSPWENGYVVSFNGKLRDQLLNGGSFDTLLEANVLIACWKRRYKQVRPHSSLGYRSPALEAHEPRMTASALLLQPFLDKPSSTQYQRKY